MSDDSDDDMPLAARVKKEPVAATKGDDDSDDDMPLVEYIKPDPRMYTH
jgi:hypothetical protein